MDLVTRLVRALLLLALLLALDPSPGVAKELCPQPCRCPGRGQLDCRHAGLATVAPASRRWALTVVDFTGNSIAAVGKQAWKDYPWTETLVLRDNELRAVKSHSLEGLFLLKHLDLSCNEILSIEERAFEPLPFLKLLNLSGNGLTHIRSGTFQAWHGMRFLQELILSHNPLAVVADDAFFKLPSLSSLDLSATQVTSQTLLLLLQTTLSLETLQVPKDVACCLCQKRPLAESLCRSIQFFCEKLCSTSAPQCAHTSLLRTRGAITDVEQPRKLNIRPVLCLKPKEPSVGDHGTVTLAVALSLSTEGDVSSLDNSRTSSDPPQHLLGHKGGTSVDDLRTKLKKKLYKSESIKTVKSIVSHHPQPAGLKDVLEKTLSSWDLKKQDSRLNWQALNPWDLPGDLNQPKKEHSQYRVGQNQFFFQLWRPLKVEPKPRADQGLNRNLDFLSDPLVQSRPTVSSRGKATAEEVHSYLGGHPLIIPDTINRYWTQQKEGSMFLNKPWNPESPDLAPVPGELLETTIDHQLRLLVPDKGLQRFMLHMERALRVDCMLPQLQLACAKMVSKTGLLLKMLSERQENQGVSDHMDQCCLQESTSRYMALGEDKQLTGEKPEHIEEMVMLVVLLSLFIIIGVMLPIFFYKRCRPCELDCQPCHTGILCLRRLCVKLPQRGRKDEKMAQDVEQNRAVSSSQCCPSSQPARASLTFQSPSFPRRVLDFFSVQEI